MNVPPKRKRVEFADDVSPWELELYLKLSAAVEEKRAREAEAAEKRAAQDVEVTYAQRRAALIEECPHPIALAQKLDSTIVITPAIELISKSWAEAINTADGRCVTSLPPQNGKAVDVDEDVLTLNGWVKMGDLRVGDHVYHPDGRPTRVNEAHKVQVDRPCYRVTTTDGRTVVVDGEHLWTVTDKYREKRRRGLHGEVVRHSEWETITTHEIISRGLESKWKRPNGKMGRSFRFRLPRQYPIISQDVELPIDPYVLGAWLGDGTTTSAEIASADPEIIEHIRATGLEVEDLRSPSKPYAWLITRREAYAAAKAAAVELVGEGLSAREAMRRTGIAPGSNLGGVRCADLKEARSKVDPKSYVPRIKRSFRHDLRELGVLGNKHVPSSYLEAGTAQRLALLQGLMDTDGTIASEKYSSRQTSFTSCTKALSEAVLFLVRSLGWRATIKERDAKLNGRIIRKQWTVFFTVDQDDPYCPFRLSRKVQRVGRCKSRSNERFAVSIASVERVESRPVRCITVERGDGLFLIGRDLMVTHNSLTSRWTIFWALIQNPNRRCIFASYGMQLARTSGRIIRSFVEIYGAEYGLFLDQAHHDAADWQLSGFLGGVLSAGIGSSLTGRPADLMLLDDLLSGQAEANSQTVKRSVEEWWESVARTRMAPGTPAIALGTRWAIDDILSRFINEGWKRINIPAVAEPGIHDSLADIPDGRTSGGYLVSTRGTTPDDFNKMRAEMGVRAFTALMQGAPTPLEGGVWKRDWLDAGRVGVDGRPECPRLREIAVGVDPAETGTGDEAGIIVMGVGLADSGLYVLGDLSGRYTTAQWARRVCLAWLTYNANRVIQERSVGSRAAIPDAWALLRRQAVALIAYGSVERAAEVLGEAGDEYGADLDGLREAWPLADRIVEAGKSGPRVVSLVPRQSKLIRAESAAGPFEMGKAHMVGEHPDLEFQMLTWNPSDSGSPDRVDALSLLVNQLDRPNSGRSAVLV